MTGSEFMLAAIAAAAPAWVAAMVTPRGPGQPGPDPDDRAGADGDGPVRLKGVKDSQRRPPSDSTDDRDDHEALAAAVLSGDPDAVRRFHDTFADRLHQFFVVRVGHARVDAEDLLQDTLIAAINGLPNRRGESSLWTWVMSVARRKLVDFYRARSRRPAFVEAPDEHTDASRLFDRLIDMDVLERMTLEVDLPRLVRMAITRLTPAQQELLGGMYDEGLSVRELADRHGLTTKAAESALYRAREAFKSGFATIWRSAHGTDHPVVEATDAKARRRRAKSEPD